MNRKLINTIENIYNYTKDGSKPKKSKTPLDLGRLVIETTMVGFDTYAHIILQAHNYFADVKKT